MATLPDDMTRRLVGTDGLDQTLFVEAGAGTGKTTLLVQRIVSLVLQRDPARRVRLRSIAAITFTEAAAGELQSRVRAEFEREQSDAEASGDTDRAALCAQAIEETDLAAITTLHGFANRILGEFSVSAGLPPRVRVLDEVSSQLAHEARWQRFVDALYDDPTHLNLLVTAAALDIAFEPQYPRHTTLRDVAVEFNQNWDRLQPLVERDIRPLPPIDLSAFDEAVRDLAGYSDDCTDPEDKLFLHLERVTEEMQAVVQVADPLRKLRLLVNKRRSPQKGWGRGVGGKGGNWKRPVPEIKGEITAVNEAMESALNVITDRVLLDIGALIANETVAAATARREEGGLEFHDLLVLARALLRRDSEARRALHQRYTHLLLDEFQDTDPIQIELAVLIATDVDDVQGRSWSDLPVAAGRLFFVGDPKQSIYRFRRADIGLFLRARDRFSGPAGAHQLTTNFRSVEPVVNWVNAMFSTVMAEEMPERQPKYQDLAAFREGSAESDRHLPILLGGPHADPKVNAADLRVAEADDVVGAIKTVLARPDDFRVAYRDRAGRSRWRTPELSDITILLPTRTSLPFLKAALDDASLRYRIATGTLVYDTQEVVDALAALRAIDDPTDAISLVAALRSSLYACSDVDLFTWKQAGGRWDHRSACPQSVPSFHPVAEAYEHLRSLWRERWFLTPSALLNRLLLERKAAMLAFGSGRPADVWRRLRFLVEQARAFEESGLGGLRAFTDWADLQSGPMARVHEPLLPETDEAALSIQTIHGSKGLEFPITILSGMTTQMQRPRTGVSVLWDDVGPPEIKVRSGTATMRHEPRADLEAEMDQYERLRLAYVAATRARDHLIVSCHHKPNNKNPTYGQRFWDVFQDEPHQQLWRQLDPADDDSGIEIGASSAQMGFALDARNQWQQRRTELFLPFSQPRVMSATAVARAARLDESTELDEQDDDGADRPEDGAVPERRRGRTGSAIGSAVHAVLQLIDLAQPADIEDLVTQQAHAEGVPHRTRVVESLVRAALDSDAVRLAAQHRHYKELFVAAPIEGRVLEGYVDLLVESPQGLVVVDYKTDSVRSEADIDAKLAGYELQAAAYAVALEQATGQRVSECRFVFLRKAGSIERTVADLPTAMTQVRSTVAGLAFDHPATSAGSTA